MPIDPDALTSLAGGYAKGMTSIRGRRVQRLLKREFAGADYVLVLQLESGAAAVLGLSARGAPSAQLTAGESTRPSSSGYMVQRKHWRPASIC
jgi:hypothetical protein